MLKAIAAAATALCFATAATATTERVGVITAIVDISEQEMQVAVNGALVATWPVSTARPGKRTPTGDFRAQWLSPHHRSSLYDGAPMPWSIFFNGDYAIHGTNQTNRLGQPASAGCVRLHTENAKILFDMVRAAGMDNMNVVIRQ